jgi:hypothetical protein
MLELKAGIKTKSELACNVSDANRIAKPAHVVTDRGMETMLKYVDILLSFAWHACEWELSFLWFTLLSQCCETLSMIDAPSDANLRAG